MSRIIPGKKNSPLAAIIYFVAALLIIGIPVTLFMNTPLSGSLRQKTTKTSNSLEQCRENCRTIGSALDMYGLDNDGQYPRDLSDLVPRYLESIPTCPATGSDSYSGSYHHNSCQGDACRYTFFCQGDYHTREPRTIYVLTFPVRAGTRETGYPENHPCYVSPGGLVMPVK